MLTGWEVGRCQAGRRRGGARQGCRAEGKDARQELNGKVLGRGEVTRRSRCKTIVEEGRCQTGGRRVWYQAGGRQAKGRR